MEISDSKATPELGVVTRGSAADAARTHPPAEGPLRGERQPASALLTYYVLQAIVTGPGLIVMLPLRFFRYHTLRYAFDDEGVTMRWGILFRREISLTYARIQDMHLTSNVIERWLGLGRVQIQTASGQSGAEMTIEGLPDFEQVRDQLYRRMRGARGLGSEEPAADAAVTPATTDAVAAALHDAVAELRAIRGLLEARTGEDR
ncbi:MAG: PH domain-containing protein [Longimicrobiales bacterium]